MITETLENNVRGEFLRIYGDGSEKERLKWLIVPPNRYLPQITLFFSPSVRLAVAVISTTAQHETPSLASYAILLGRALVSPRVLF